MIGNEKKVGTLERRRFSNIRSVLFRSGVYFIPEFVLGPGSSVVVPEEADQGCHNDREHDDRADYRDDHSFRGD